MTDKLQKIKEWISKEQDGLMDAQGNFEYPEHEGAYHILCNLDAYINSLQEEPSKFDAAIQEGDDVRYNEDLECRVNLSQLKRVAKKEEPESEDSKKHISLVTERMLKEGPILTLRGKEKADFENEFNRFKQITGMINWPSREEIYKNVILWFIAWSRDHLKIGDIVDKSEIDKHPVSEELEEALAREWQSYNDRGAATVDALEDNTQELTFAKGFYRGAKWQKENLWKPVDGDDLPDIDREVIALLDNGKIVFAHRPYKGKYIGKNLTTGNIETFENMTYDKGGWNQPDIRWWLDTELPKEIEL